jgi:hypothetical protein
MNIKIFKQEELLFDVNSNDMTEEKKNDLVLKLEKEIVESVKIEFIDGMTLDGINDFMLNPEHCKVLTQILVLK